MSTSIPNARFERIDGTAAREIAPGVVIERRQLLWMPAAALLGAWTRGHGRKESRPAGVQSSKPASAPAATGRITFEQFLAEAVPGARARLADRSPSGQDAYLWYLASLAVRILEIPEPSMEPFGAVDPAIRFGRNFAGPPFLVLHWRMGPDALLPAHPHMTANVCTLGLEGDARMRNFEIVGAPDTETRDSFRVRCTHSEILKPGRVNTLSTARDNLHEFRAGPRGARGIDITTAVADGDATTRFLELPDRPVDGHPFLYDAKWK